MFDQEHKLSIPPPAINYMYEEKLQNCHTVSLVTGFDLLLTLSKFFLFSDHFVVKLLIFRYSSTFALEANIQVA